jgi:hypothetical protein
MSTARTCKHCNGTTYCGGSISATSGKLRTRPACPTCLVKSRLDPAGIYDRVVCSVCHGTGAVLPASETAPSRQASPWGFAAVVAVVLAAVAFFSISLIFYLRALKTPDEMRQAIQEQSRNSARESRDAIKLRVGVGMTRDYVEYALGEPDSSREMRNGNAILELWNYECADGHVEISILDGKVQSVKP